MRHKTGGRTHWHKQLNQFESKRDASDPVIQAKNYCCFRFEHDMNWNLRHIEIVIVSSANLIRPTFRLHKSWKVYIYLDTYLCCFKAGLCPFIKNSWHIHTFFPSIQLLIMISIIDSMNLWTIKIYCREAIHPLVMKYLFLFHTSNMIYHRFHENLSLMLVSGVISDSYIYLSQTRTMKWVDDNPIW